MGYSVKSLEEKLTSIRKYETLTFFSTIVYTEMAIFAISADTAKILEYNIIFLLQTIESSW